MRPEIIAAITILTIAAYIDWKEKRVPNWLTFSAWGLGLLFNMVVGGVEGLWIGFVGSMVGLGTLVIPYALNGMGAGDVKLMAAVGAWVGAGATLEAFLWIIIFGGLMGTYSIVRSSQVKERVVTALVASRNLVTLKSLDAGRGQAPEKILLPYGVPIAFGFYAYFLFGGLL